MGRTGQAGSSTADARKKSTKSPASCQSYRGCHPTSDAHYEPFPAEAPFVLAAARRLDEPHEMVLALSPAQHEQDAADGILAAHAGLRVGHPPIVDIDPARLHQPTSLALR